MSLGDRLCSLAMRAYPRDFRLDSQEEMLSTIADLRNAGSARGPVGMALSLSYNGNRMRWLHATGGSVVRTLEQGLSWGVLLLIAYQSSLHLAGIFRLWASPFYSPSLGYVALAIGWLAVFVLLVSGRRGSGLTLLAVVLAGYFAREVTHTVMAPTGPYRRPLTVDLQIALPTVLPLLLAYVPSSKPTRLSWSRAAALFAVVLLVVTTAVPALRSGLGPQTVDWLFDRGLSLSAASYASWGIQFGGCFILGLIVFLASLTDPRWAAAVSVMVLVPLMDEFTSEIGRVTGFSGYSGVIILAVLIPGGALLLSFWARRRALPQRAR